MRVKTSELLGVALDWAVAKCEGKDRQLTHWLYGLYIEKERYSPSNNCAQSRAIIRRAHIWTKQRGAFILGKRGEYLFIQTGQTPLVAAMRTYVASKLGEHVDVPDELV